MLNDNHIPIKIREQTNEVLPITTGENHGSVCSGCNRCAGGIRQVDPVVRLELSIFSAPEKIGDLRSHPIRQKNGTVQEKVSV